MSRVGTLPTWGRRAAWVGAAAGVVAAGAAVGIAAERYAVGRSFRGPDPEADEPLGRLRGEPVRVTADDDVALHVEVDEARDCGPVTVVFCHGLALDQGSWHYQRRDLADVGRLVFWDQRGHGRSGRGAPGNATIDQLGRDLRRVLEEAAPTGPIVLVGHSMGGMTVMALADQHPELFGERVIGVALVSTSPGRLAEVGLGVPAAAGRVLRRVAPRALAALNRRPDFVARGRKVGSDLSFVLTKRYGFDTDVPPSLVRFVAQMHEHTPLDVLAELFPAFDAHDKLDALRVLNGVETLIMCGEGDLLTPADHSREMVEHVPGAELVVLPEAGHMIMLEHYDVVTDHLRALVERALRAAAAA
ncbi:MAG TPA: alpha/beta hydrolase [Candidatus Eisenbacteria bacterium]|nr:alpha/beta hydrolase [Candidatus Eisenbacteria bacterium]